MGIANIFCQSLGVTSHSKMFLTVCRFRTDLVFVLTARGIRSKKIVIRSNDLGYPFEKSCHPFALLGLSVWKKLSSVRTAWDIRLKKLLSARTARAIRSKKNLSTDQNHFVASHSRRTICYSPGHVRYEFCLQTYHIWIVTHLCSFVAIFAFILWMLLKRGTGSGERGTGNGSLGTSCQRKPPEKSKMAGKDQERGKIDDREA